MIHIHKFFALTQKIPKSSTLRIFRVSAIKDNTWLDLIIGFMVEWKLATFSILHEEADRRYIFCGHYESKQWHRCSFRLTQWHAIVLDDMTFVFFFLNLKTERSKKLRWQLNTKIINRILRILFDFFLGHCYIWYSINWINGCLIDIRLSFFYFALR